LLGLPTDLLDVLDVSGLVVVLDDLGSGAAPPKEKLTRPIELPVRETFRRTR
jgi:hypothetical protein